MRLKALKHLKYKEADVKIIEDATIDQLKAYIIKDNVSGGEWDAEMLNNDWDIDTLKEWGLDDNDFKLPTKEKTAAEDDFDEDKDKVKTIVKPGELWKLGSDMGRAVTGGGLHGKDLSKADTTVNIVLNYFANNLDKEIEATCAIGDYEISILVDNTHSKLCFHDLYKHAKKIIEEIGGFEKLAENGLI